MMYFWKGVYLLLDLILGLFLLPLRTIKLIYPEPVDKTYFHSKPDCADAILLIHGSGVNELQFVAARYILNNLMLSHNKTFRVYSCDLSSGSVITKSDESIELYSDRVREYINQNIYSKPTNRLILIGHSMGGLVAGLVALHDPKVKVVVTLGTPWHGAPLLDYVINFPTFRTARHRQMMKNSSFLSALRDNIYRKNHFNILTIGSQYDVQVPKDHYFLSHQKAVHKELNGYGHSSMIVIPNVWKIIFEHI